MTDALTTADRLLDAGIATMVDAVLTHGVTSRDLVAASCARIRSRNTLHDGLNAVLAVDDDATMSDAAIAAMERGA